VEEKSKKCGVGLVFRPTRAADGRVELKVFSLIPKSPADMCGMIRPDDTLTHVDNIDVSDFTVNEVAPLVVGERGSEVRLTFSRGEEEFQVTILRVWGGK